MHKSHQQPGEALDFLALQYLGDELTEDARAAFEARLMDDQSAREAVAGAVEVTLAAREAFAEDALLVSVREEARRPAGKRAWWNVALAGAALAALVLVSQSLELGKRSQSAVSTDLAMAWSEARGEWPTSALNDEQTEEAESFVGEDELALPTWMIAAVSDTKLEMSETNPGDTVPE